MSRMCSVQVLTVCHIQATEFLQQILHDRDFSNDAGITPFFGYKFVSADVCFTYERRKGDAYFEFHQTGTNTIMICRCFKDDTTHLYVWYVLYICVKWPFRVYLHKTWEVSTLCEVASILLLLGFLMSLYDDTYPHCLTYLFSFHPSMITFSLLFILSLPHTFLYFRSPSLSVTDVHAWLGTEQFRPTVDLSPLHIPRIKSNNTHKNTHTPTQSPLATEPLQEMCHSPMLCPSRGGGETRVSHQSSTPWGGGAARGGGCGKPRYDRQVYRFLL